MHYTRIISAVLALGMLIPVSTQARKKDKGQANAPAVEKTEFEKNTDGCEHADGLLGLYLKEGRLLVEVPMEIMGKDVMIASVISSVTDNAFSSPGEMPTAPMQVFFSMENGKLAMCRHRFDLETGDDNIQRSLDLNTIRTILMVFDVKAWNNDRSAVLVDMTEFFAGNQSELRPFPKSHPSGLNVREQFKRNLSFVSGIKSFEGNSSVRSVLSYSVSATDSQKKPTRYADTPYTVEVTRTISLLPEDKMPLKEYDPRINAFHFSKTRFASDNAAAKNVLYAQKWRISEDRPLVFYIDPAFPESWKPWVKKGVEIWQEAFGAIGIDNAIQARDYPEDDPQFDPDNLRYCCVRYSPSTLTNAMGPMWFDPRSGEILSANVTVNHNIIKLIRRWLFVQTAAVDPRVRQETLPEDLFGECLAYVVSHEIGHTLGLMHNMAGSSGIPVESLRDPEFTSRFGTTYSIMDYARFNYVAQPGDPERGVKLCPPSLGVADKYAIEWLYSENLPENFVCDKSADPRFRYGIQQIGGVIDPSSIDEDLGDDPVAASNYGIENLKRIAREINNWCGSWDKDFSFRRDAANQMINQYQRYISACMYNIGGRYTNPHLEGDRWIPSLDVPAERQKASVAFILEQTGDLEWLDSEEMKLCRSKKDNLASAMAVSILKSMLQKLSSLPASGEDSYTKEEFLADVSSFVLGPTRKSQSLNQIQRDLQIQWVSFLLNGSELDTRRAITSDNSAVALCHARLMEFRKLAGRMASTGDGQTRDHYAFIIHRIDKSLNR